MDASDVGQYGTLSFLKQNDAISTSYPIDDEEITIGRDQSCSLRLYYAAVSALHAKITFQDRKAFLVVLGTNGVLLDDEPLHPAPDTAPGPTTVPLQNNAVIEIHKKRFRFTYPPKHLRTPLLPATPATAVRRPLRLSMIASATVFSPRPSHDPQENLRILQTPLITRDDEEIVLVHTNTPRVVEEDQDLVILDEAPLPLPLPLPIPQNAQYPPRTPARRPPRPSLHRAVLIRSAQRVMLEKELQREDEEDADEVEDAIDAISEESEDQEDDEDDDNDEDEDDDEEQDEGLPRQQQPPSSWRKSLSAVRDGLGWALRGLSMEPKDEDEEDSPVMDNEQEGDAQDVIPQPQFNEPQNDYEEDDDAEDNHEPEEQSTPIAPPRPLGRFMTPQAARPFPAQDQQQQLRMSMGPGAPRLSMGGAESGPRRIRVVEPWKVNEIVVPAPVKEEAGPSEMPGTPRARKNEVSEAEREAIRARRRSALSTPDNFFKGQTPGLRKKLIPTGAAPLPALQEALQAAAAAPEPAPEPSTSESKPEQQEDTAVLLARMREMVEGAKQRQSIGRRSLSLSPRKRDGGFSLLAPEPHLTKPRTLIVEADEDEDEEGDSDEKENEEEPAARPLRTRLADELSVFARPQIPTAGPSGSQQTHTPRMDGMREMFARGRAVPPPTPAMDGVEEMMRTPVGYRAPVEAPVVEHEEAQPAPVEEEPEPQPEPVPARPTRGRRGGAAATRRAPPPRSAPAKRPTRAQVEEAEAPAEPSGSAVPDSAPEAGKVVRRTRARTADGDPSQIPSRMTQPRAKAPAKKTAEEPEEDAVDDAVDVAPPQARTRRTRQATDPTPLPAPPPEPVDEKPPKRTRAKTPTPAPSTTTRRGTRTKPIDVQEEAEEEPAPAPAPAPAKARRTTRAKVKEEDKDEGVPSAPATTTRTRRTPASRLPAPAAGKSARAAATPSPTDGASGSGEAGDKENTPERNGAGEEEGEEEPAAPGARVRAGAKARAPAKTRAGAGEAAAPAPAVGATRTRTARARAAKA